MNRKLVWIDPHDPLPPISQALTLDEGANGLLAAGADLSAARLIEAYSRGIFPWFSRGEPVLWWTPSPRMVLMLDEFKISKSLRKTILRVLEDPDWEIQTNHDFQAVMQACAAPRPGQAGTWIGSAMIAAYSELHAMGYAHSVSVMHRGELLGGLYCVALGQMVFGESMFSRAADCSKLALATLVAWLRAQGALVIDCQQRTDHLASLGGREIDRSQFESMVQRLTGLGAMPWASAPPSKRDLTRL